MQPNFPGDIKEPDASEPTAQGSTQVRKRPIPRPISVERPVDEEVVQSVQYPQYTATVPVFQIIQCEGHLGSVRFTQGAFGSIYRCRVAGVEQQFAVKRVKLLSKNVLRITINEYEVLTRLRHPNIVSAYRLLLETDSSFAWVLMDLVNGHSLRQLLDVGHPFTGESYAETEVQSIARQLFSALALMHGKGLMHRDVNPANILLGGGRVTLVDFQTACSVVPGVRGVAGTAPFQAPEMWCAQGYDCKVDVWSAGAVLERLLRGNKDRCSPECADFVRMCLEPQPALRCMATQALAHSWLL